MPWSTWRREIEFFIGAPNCRLSSLLCGLAPARSDTPEIIFYSEARSQSFVDSPFPLQLNLRQGIKQESGDGEMTGPRFALASGCSSAAHRSLARQCAGAGLSVAAGEGDRSLRRRRAGRRHRPPDRQHPAGEFRPALRDREPHRRRRRDRHAGGRQVAARRLHAADDVEHPDRERIAGAAAQIRTDARSRADRAGQLFRPRHRGSSLGAGEDAAGIHRARQIAARES